MDSTSTDHNATWREGDTCLAPHPKDGILREASIQRLTSTFHSNDTAWVIFTYCDKDAEKEEGEEEEEEEEEEGEAIPVSKLSKPEANECTQEKPVFPSIVTEPKLCVPFVLSSADGVRVPYTINRYLRDYQREGIRFMYNSYVRSSGCILGDDMGLGKTVQVIGFLAAVLRKTGTWEDMKRNRPQFLQSQVPSKQSKHNKVFLIVAPLSVLYNWKDELDAWGYFQCVVVHGLRKEEELARIKKGRVEVALTTYETLRLCLDQFNNISWSAVFVDEAHKIKNPNSQITQAMKELDCKIRIGLTGTILQNNLEELWCVMDWAIPGCLGSLAHFKNKFSGPIEHSQRHSATKRALATGRKIVRALAKRISNWFLRRTKSLIKEQLPKKDDRVVYCSLTDFQRTVYQTVLETEDVTLMLRSSEKCDCYRGRTRRNCCYKRNSAGVEMKNLYFSYLAILRKVSNHVALLQSTSGTSKKQEKYLNAICQKVFQKFPEFVKRCKEEAFEALSDPMYSGKMKVLAKLLKFYFQRKDKVLLFSLSVKLLDVLENYCMAQGLDYSRLDGTTKAKDRVQIVKEFNSSSHINLCLVSTMAGGLGLNFVGANVVVLFDPTWNPANDLQAIDRAYRIGQCRDVTVLRLISLGTIEEAIYLRQIYKQQLQSSVVGKESSRRYFEAVQGHVVHKGELFGIKNLFRLQTQGTCLTRMILEREGQVEAGVMTTSTHTGEEREEREEREEGKKGVGEPADPPPTEEPAPNPEVVKENTDTATVPREVLDFSSGSEEDEEEYRFKRRAASGVDGSKSGNAATSPAQMNLAQHGFSRLLEKGKGSADIGGGSSATEGSLSDTDDEDREMTGKNKCTNASENDANFLSTPGAKSRDLNSDPEKREGGTRGEDRDRPVKNAVDWESDENTSVDKKTKKMKTTDSTMRCQKVYSDESDDFDLDVNMGPKKCAFKSHNRGQDRKRQTSSGRDKTRSKYSGDIEMYTSSEDEVTTVKKQRLRAGGKTRETDKKDKSIDSVLGGVQEVVYTHSNQRVVGGSKAEELISRAAVRDVFQLNVFSQLPANQVVGSLESLSDSPTNSWTQATDTVDKPSADHPVTFTSRSVHQAGHTTFIIGETPLAVRRQHLQEMSEKLNFPSVEEFASEVLRRPSSQRVAWLRHYYTSLKQPDLTSTVTNNFPQADSAQTSSASAAPSSTTTKTRRAKSHTGSRTTQEDVTKATRKRKNTPKNLEHKTQPDIHPNNVSAPQKKSRILQNHSPEPGWKTQNPQEDVPEAQEKQRISRKNVLEPRSNVPSSESEQKEEMAGAARGHQRTKRASVSTSGARGAGGGLGAERAGTTGLGSGNHAAPLNRTHRDAPSSPDLSRGRSAVLSKPTAQGREPEPEPEPELAAIRGTFQGRRERENPRSPSPPPQQDTSSSAHRSLLSALIGDTSILDDLFKPSSRGAQQRGASGAPPTPSGSVSARLATPPPSTITPIAGSSDSSIRQRLRVPPQVSKRSRKDFWDILIEGNEETINKLTDPDEVQRLCANTKFSVQNRIRSVKEEEEEEEEEDGSKSLWKTNEKFLWKK